MEPSLIKQLGLSMGDKSSAVRLASRIVLGLELQHLKQNLGYDGCGTYWNVRKQFKPGERLRWAQYCMAVAGISDRSATIYYQCSEAVKVRLRALSKARPGSKKLLRLMEKQPSTMTAAVLAEMIHKIIILVLSVGETQEQLLREYRGVHLPAPAKIGKSANEGVGMSLGELYERYPDEDDAKEYALGRLCGMGEEKARLFVVVRKEMRRRERLGLKIT
ncbi:MAG: hypothetical protein ABJQ29_11365 [Luteolibacter sp.]